MAAFLWWILEWGVYLVLLISIMEGIGLTILARRRGESYDWIAAAISMFDFLIREIVLRFLMPMLIYALIFRVLYQYRFFTLTFSQW